MEYRKVKRIKSGFKRLAEFPEEIRIEIVAKLPFRSIVRFKTVCRRWREVIETELFRRKFMFARGNSSSSWSIMHWAFGLPYEEVVGLYGCKRYGIPRSLYSYIPVDTNMIKAFADGLVLLETISRKAESTYIVGNPVLNQWVQLPPNPSWASAIAIGLVTRVEDGIVVEYKVVFMDQVHLSKVKVLRFEIYSSVTGKWIRKRVKCPRVSLNYKRCLSLNKKLHWLDEEGGIFVAYDFFDVVDEQQKCRVIPFPDDKTCFGRTYTTSGGFLVYISKDYFQMRLWRLEEYTNDSGRWQLMQDINLSSFGLHYHYFPLAMHPFETHIIYMVLTNYKRRLVSVDLKTHKRTRYTSKSSTSSDKMLSHYKGYANSSLFEGRHHNVFYAPQFILPQWMESLPPLPSV